MNFVTLHTPNRTLKRNTSNALNEDLNVYENNLNDYEIKSNIFAKNFAKEI
jgi:hypothetical protein